tara:strand:- start:287 stop:1435 length:1149 start_codon:yes stop_codon:yes gene_type:complete
MSETMNVVNEVPIEEEKAKLKAWMVMKKKSEENVKDTMTVVDMLMRGQGVTKAGKKTHLWKGRVITREDDLVALREEAKKSIRRVAKKTVDGKSVDVALPDGVEKDTRNGWFVDHQLGIWQGFKEYEKAAAERGDLQNAPVDAANAEAREAAAAEKAMAEKVAKEQAAAEKQAKRKREEDARLAEQEAKRQRNEQAAAAKAAEAQRAAAQKLEENSHKWIELNVAVPSKARTQQAYDRKACNVTNPEIIDVSNKFEAKCAEEGVTCTREQEVGWRLDGSVKKRVDHFVSYNNMYGFAEAKRNCVDWDYAMGQLLGKNDMANRHWDRAWRNTKRILIAEFAQEPDKEDQQLLKGRGVQPWWPGQSVVALFEHARVLGAPSGNV